MSPIFIQDELWGYTMNDKVRKILIVILSIILIFSLSKIIYISSKNAEEDNEFKDLIEKVQVTEIAKETEVEEIKIDESIEETQEDLEAKQREIEARLAKYQELYKENSDLFGWIKIDDTPIDYPVMFTPNDPEYYLHRSFKKKNTYSGCIFVDAACKDECNNYLLHGHHMKNGTMFAGLMKYKEKSYWESHPVIKFDTLTEANEYEIVAAFESKVYKVTDEVFKYYNYTNIDSEERFDEYIEGINKLRLYDTGVGVEYGDEFITLSTCAYHTQDGRFVVVGVKKK